jgi:hypothetical protein
MEAGDSRTADLLEVHKIISQELRHTATVIWRFSIAIVTLQGGALGLSAMHGFQTILGEFVLGFSFFLSICFSVMLIRQATERRGFVDRIHAVEAELRKTYPLFFARIDSRFFHWFKSTKLAWLLLIESVIGFVFFSVEQVKDRLTAIHAATPTYSLVDSLRFTQSSSPTPEPSPTPAETPVPRAIPVATPTLTPLPSPHPTPHRRHPRRHR